MSPVRKAQQTLHSAAQVEALGAELAALRDRIRSELGERDARYIRRVLELQRFAEVAGRGLLFAGALPPAWASGVALLSLSKILENMEIGHNVLHGQYDWMRERCGLEHALRVGLGLSRQPNGVIRTTTSTTRSRTSSARIATSAMGCCVWPTNSPGIRRALGTRCMHSCK